MIENKNKLRSKFATLTYFVLTMPNNQGIKAQTILEINESHEIANKLKELYKEDKEKLEKYTKVLYAQARLIEGLTIENPTEISNLVCEIMVK